MHLSSNSLVSRCGNIVLRKDGTAVRGMVITKSEVSVFETDPDYRLCKSCFGRCGPRDQGSTPVEESVPPVTCASPFSSGVSCDSESSSVSAVGSGDDLPPGR